MVTGDLPTMPNVAALVVDKLSEVGSSPREIQQLISKDQALAARVLRVANSPFYGYSKTINRLTDAIAIMGYNSIRSLVLTSVFNDFFKSFGLTEKLLWEHSLTCASISQRIAKSSKFPKIEEAFLVGLMHDIGKVILNLRLPQKMSQIVQEVYNAQQSTFSELEQESFGFTHSEVGQAIAGKWNFAKEIEEAIGNHHHPEMAKVQPSLSYIVHLANAFCHKLEIGPVKDPSLNLMALESTRVLKLSQSAIDQLLDDTSQMLASQQEFALF
jgi:putative nucleotidyltransferase with HDIG domain